MTKLILLTRCLKDGYGTSSTLSDEDVMDDVSATAKHARLLFKHPIVQSIVNCEDGESALLLLETVETLLKTEKGTGSN